jgi:hypothetical protein
MRAQLILTPSSSMIPPTSTGTSVLEIDRAHHPLWPVFVRHLRPVRQRQHLTGVHRTTLPDPSLQTSSSEMRAQCSPQNVHAQAQPIAHVQHQFSSASTNHQPCDAGQRRSLRWKMYLRRMTLLHHYPNHGGRNSMLPLVANLMSIFSHLLRLMRSQLLLVVHAHLGQKLNLNVMLQLQLHFRHTKRVNGPRRTAIPRAQKAMGLWNEVH